MGIVGEAVYRVLNDLLTPTPNLQIIEANEEAAAMKSSKQLAAILAVAALVGPGAASATLINAGLVDGENTLEDQDRDAFVDVDLSGTISVGDVFVGYARIDDYQPSGASVNDEVYAVFAQEISAFLDVSGSGAAETVSFVSSTVTGLTLEDITGDPNTSGDMFAIYDAAGGFGDLIGDPSAGGANSDLNDIIDDIVGSGTLRLTIGFRETDDFFTATNNEALGVVGGAPTSALAAAPSSINFSNFEAGMSVNYNNTAFRFNELVAAVNPITSTLSFHDFVIVNGAARGASGSAQPGVWTNASGYGVGQGCVDGTGSVVSCGAVTDIDAVVNVTRVPEPGVIGLLGAGLLGLAGGLHRRRKQTLVG